MNTKTKALIFLLISTFIWGLSYPIGRHALDTLSPWSFSGLRFFFGSMAVVPLALRWRRHQPPAYYMEKPHPHLWLWGGLCAGLLLGVGSGFQMYGLADSTAAKAGFISGLYVAMVPLIGFIMGLMPRTLVWVGLAFGLVGLFILSGGGGDSSSFTRGDALMLVADIFWAVHVVAMGYFAARVNPWLFTATQSVTTCVFDLGMAWFTGTLFTWPQFFSTLPWTMWGIMSVGVAYVCQAMGQKDSSPTSAALVMQFQAVVACVAGVLFLNEAMTKPMIIGAAILVGGTLLAQFAPDPSPITREHKWWKPLMVTRVGLAAIMIVAPVVSIFLLLNK